MSYHVLPLLLLLPPQLLRGRTPARTADLLAVHHSEVLRKLRAGTFEEEVSKLMYRYTEGTVCSGKGAHAHKIAVTHQRAMPTGLRTILHDILGSQKERFKPAALCALGWAPIGVGF